MSVRQELQDLVACFRAVTAMTYTGPIPTAETAKDLFVRRHGEGVLPLEVSDAEEAFLRNEFMVMGAQQRQTPAGSGSVANAALVEEDHWMGVLRNQKFIHGI